jgi:hypothetical protein
MALIPSPTKIGFDQNYQNNVNIQCPTCPGAVNIKIDAQVAYKIQLGRSWSPWNGKEITFRIIGHSESVLVLHRHFWPLGHVSCLAH